MYPSVRKHGTIPLQDTGMRRLAVLSLLWTVCLVAGWGCGKEPPVVKTAPIPKGRFPNPHNLPTKRPKTSSRNDVSGVCCRIPSLSAIVAQTGDAGPVAAGAS
jgi:hypothetical protein